MRRAVNPLVLLVLLLAGGLLAGCTDGTADAPAGSDGQGAVAAVPQIPAPAGTTPPSEEVEPPDVPSPRPRPGAYVLAALEGPLTDQAATDVVLRTERGVELDRFRLPGARAVLAPLDGARALVPTTDGTWAVLDAADSSLGLVTFPDRAPTDQPRMRGALAWWPDPEQPWLLRLDGGTPMDLAELVGGPAEVVDVSRAGGHALVRTGDGAVVVDTASGDVTAVEAGDAVDALRTAMAEDGTVVAMTATDGQAELRVQPPGEPARVLGTLGQPGVPVPLPDGRIAVLGAESTLVAPDGTARALPPVTGIAAAPLASADGRVVLIPTAGDLVVLDVDAGVVRPIPDTAGYRPHDHPATGWLWAASPADAAGLAVVDVDTATGRVLLDDVVTQAITSTALDGSQVAVGTGPGTVVVDADGTVRPPAPDADATTDVALHPRAEPVAVAVVRDATRTLLVGDPIAPQTRVDTGRSPAWLRTGLG